MKIALIACAAFCVTYAGGLFALRLHDKLHLVLGFSAGAVVAVGLVDLIPEAISLGSDYHTPATLLTWTTLSFVLYLLLDRIQLLHSHAAHHHEHDVDHTTVPAAGGRVAMGAGSFSAHSFLDGVAIGVAFQASTTVGTIVTIAVLTHDFSDGINTVNVVVKNGGSRRQARLWLLADALAPAIGVGSTLLFTMPQDLMGTALAIFAGFFIYIGASDLIPESYHAHPKFLTTAMTLLGAGVICIVVHVASI